MTPIAYRDGVLAGDTLTTANGARDGHLQKVRRVGRVLIGFAGSIPAGLRFESWVRGGMSGPSPYEGTDHGNAILVSTAGIVCWSGRGPWPITSEFYALGSGCEFATGAMEMGATAAEAVAIAMRHSIESGGTVTTLRLESAVLKAAE